MIRASAPAHRIRKLRIETSDSTFILVLTTTLRDKRTRLQDICSTINQFVSQLSESAVSKRSLKCSNLNNYSYLYAAFHWYVFEFIFQIFNKEKCIASVDRGTNILNSMSGTSSGTVDEFVTFSFCFNSHSFVSLSFPD